jgi:CxxC motif-containing protein (DUF1111 family)
MEFYLLNYFKPGIGAQSQDTQKGEEALGSVGCTSCHKPTLTILHDRRVADVETVFDPVNGVFNRLYATATPRFTAVPDSSGFPASKVPSMQPFVVQRIFTDFKRHDLGPAFHERNFDGTVTTHFMTEPLWGVGSSPPYGHDGRSSDLLEVILRHGGEAQASRDAFAALPARKQAQVIAFLSSLVLFPPDDTASNLDPGAPWVSGYPQFGHGSIKLTVLFNDPLDGE